MTNWRYHLGRGIFRIGQRLSGRRSVLATACECLVKGYWNESYDEDSNGERWLIRKLVSLWSGDEVIVVDGGANRGKWSERFLAGNTRIRNILLVEANPRLAADLSRLGWGSRSLSFTRHWGEQTDRQLSSWRPGMTSYPRLSRKAHARERSHGALGSKRYRSTASSSTRSSPHTASTGARAA